MDNNLTELFAALSAAQGEIEAAAFDRTNPNFRNRYATLNSVREAIRLPFAKHGLGVTQDPVFDKLSQEVGCVTTIFHKSGQFIKSRELQVPVIATTSREKMAAGIVEPITAQHVGIAITYAKRYSLCAILNLTSDEDDDGNAVSGHGEIAAQPPRPPQPAQPTQPVAQPTKPIAQPAQPTQPTQAAQPTKPMQPTQPTQPMQPPRSPQPVQPAQPPQPPKAPVRPLSVNESSHPDLGVAQQQLREKYAQLKNLGLADGNTSYLVVATDTVEVIQQKIIEANKILRANGISS